MAIWKPSRRQVLATLGAGALAAGGGGLWLGVRKLRGRRWARAVTRPGQAFTPSVFLAINPDGVTTIWLTRSEMGQGVATALPMILAEELDADWSKVRVEHASAGAGYDYGSLFTAASSSVRSSWIELRQAGAAARAMLLAAGADALDAAEADCRTEAGAVVHPTKGRKTYGELAAAAAAQSPPLRPQLKDPSQFRLIGKPVPRTDVPAKTRGAATFGVDVRRPGLVHAVIARAPSFGATLAGYDAGPARAVEGVLEVVQIPSGVAVVGKTSWAAMQGRDALVSAGALRWTPGPDAKLSSAAIADTLTRLLDGGGAATAKTAGDPASLDRAAKKIEATYHLPFAAHLPMEPLNCVAMVAGGTCEVWAPTQDPDGARIAAATAAGLPTDKVTLHTTYLGGGFGRRSVPDEVAEAVLVAAAIKRPVQVLWTREDDIRHDRFREISVHRLSASVDDQGGVHAWSHRLVTPSIEGRNSDAGEIDGIATGGAVDLPYAIPNLKVEWRSAELPVPVAIWRAVGHSYNAFAVESFLDEIAAASGQSPLDLRLRLLAGSPRLKACLERVAARAGWSARRAPGRALGIATAACFGSHVAQVAEVSAGAGVRLRVHKVWCSVDCGVVVNPDIVAAQIEGGIVYALTAALSGPVTVADGAVVQSNFHDLPLLRFADMPEIDVDIVPSGEPPGGVGELGVPAAAPAVFNALFALTKQRVRTLPIES